MASLGNNYGSSSMVRNWKTMYAMAKVVNDTEKMKRVIASINRSNYAVSTKQKLIKELTK